MIYIHSDGFTLGKKRNAVEASGFYKLKYKLDIDLRVYQ